MNIKYTLGAICTIPLLPFMYLESKFIRKNIPDLPEATGLTGSANKGTAINLNLLIVGESTMAGVGVSTNEEGFAGSLAKELAKALEQTVQWKLYAKSGYNVKKVTQEIFPTIEENKVDLIVIGIGANDAFELNSPRKWRSAVQLLIDKLQGKFNNTPIYFTNMPPIKSFPALSPLLRYTVGNLAELLEAELMDVIKDQSDIHYDTKKFTVAQWRERHQVELTSEEFFSDGIHPSKLAYQLWAKDIAAFIIKNR